VGRPCRAPGCLRLISHLFNTKYLFPFWINKKEFSMKIKKEVIAAALLGKHADVRAPGCPGIFTCWQYCLSGASSCDPDAMMDECKLVGPDLFPPRQAQQRPSTPVDNSSAAINLK
jgi:hypothetical protein